LLAERPPTDVLPYARVLECRGEHLGVTGVDRDDDPSP